MSARRYSDHHQRRRMERIVLAAALVVLLAAIPALALAVRGSGTAREAGTAAPDGETYIRAGIPATGGSAGLPTVWSTKPPAVKGVYITGPTAGSRDLDEYIELAAETEVNAFVVDVKENGKIMYPSQVPLAKEIGATTNAIPDLEKMVAKLEKNDIYAIARLAVFQDDILPRERPDLAVMNSVTGGPWVNYNEVAWANAYRGKVWEYNVEIAKEAARAGFDEIQFDYVRFPSDGPMDQIDYGDETFPTPEDAIAGFLEYARGELAPMDVEISADVFGLVGQNDQGGIGQVLSKMVPHLDVLSPMPYPSHYQPGNYGYPNPNAEPYGVIQASMREFMEKSKKANPHVELRPWIQDFDLGAPPYGPAEVRAQIQATYDLGLTGWLLWNAANEYTEEALRPEGEGGGPGESSVGAGRDQYAEETKRLSED